MTPLLLQLQEPSLILLIGPAGSGKSTFGKRFFRDFEVLRSDHFRELLSNSENALEVSGEARELYQDMARRRLQRKLTTVIDATNVDAAQRSIFLAMAKEAGAIPVALVFALPEEECLTRNRIRSFRTVAEADLFRQIEATEETCRSIAAEGFAEVVIFRSQEEVNQFQLDRPEKTYTQKYSGVPYDIIGDIHGSLDNLIAILRNLGYVVRVKEVNGQPDYLVSHPEERTIIFLGTLTQQCEDRPELRHFVQALLTSGIASLT